MDMVFYDWCGRHLYRRCYWLSAGLAYWFISIKNIAAKEDIEKGEALMERYGVIAVFIGGITPLPDFLLAYLAGFTHMPFLKFTLSDGIARLLRSLLVTYCLNRLHTIINVDRFGIWISILILV